VALATWKSQVIALELPAPKEQWNRLAYGPALDLIFRPGRLSGYIHMNHARPCSLQPGSFTMNHF
jgi:hypothetical protein